MSNIPIKIACPLGKSCEEIKDGAIVRCAWYIKLAGENPATGEKIEDSNCVMSWLPIMLVENTKQQVNTAAAVSDFKNEMVVSNESSHRLLAATMQFPQLHLE